MARNLATLPRIAIGNLIESMDFCDATRSHESRPLNRLRERAQTRRDIRLAIGVLAVLMVLLLLAMFAH